MPHASGLASAIRGAAESDTFDLAGQNVGTITTNINNAFSEPLSMTNGEMIRLTFVTGAGKLARQKYDENAAKAVTAALRKLGFEEDRAASCVAECAGTFKLQHDLGKNLKTVVVFPNIVAKSSAEGRDAGGADVSSARTDAGVFAKGSPEEMIALSSQKVFESMVKSRCPSWSQKKGCVAAINSIKNKLGEMEQKLLHGTPLSDAEQSLYDGVSANALDEKQEFVKELMHTQVDNDLLTSQEKQQLLNQVSERLETIAKDLDEAQNENKPKKVEKLKTMQEKAQARKEKLTKISPRQPHPLKHHAEIFKMRKELQPLLDLENGAKGRLLSIKETQALARKEEILEEISELEEKSRGWFEDDESFSQRVEACGASWASQSKQKKKTATKSNKTAGSSSTKSAWVTGSVARKPASKPKTSSAYKPTKKSGNSNVFAAMMMDSDSD